jgi:hypothetical protein
MVNIQVLEDKVTKNFSLRESRCKAGGEVVITPQVIRFFMMLQEFREWYNRVMIPNSWYRTKQHNKDVGGSPISQHLYGVAADFSFPPDDHGKPWTKERRNAFLHNVRTKWYELCDKYGVKGGVGFYDWGFHIDSGDEHRTHRAFWDYRKSFRAHYKVSMRTGRLIVSRQKEAHNGNEAVR